MWYFGGPEEPPAEAAWHQALQVLAGLWENPGPTSIQVGPIVNSKHKTLRGFQKLGGRASRTGNSALENGPSPLKRRTAGLGVGRPKGEEGRGRQARDKCENRGGERRDWQGKEGRTGASSISQVGGRPPHTCASPEPSLGQGAPWAGAEEGESHRIRCCDLRVTSCSLMWG